MNHHPAFGIDSSFRKRADSACFYEAWVGSVLARAGLCTIHQPFTIAKSRADMATYAHTWDLEVYDPESRYQTKVEVKSTNLKFDTPDSYPHETLLVCSEKSFLNKWPGQIATGRDFLFVSRLTGSILWLPAGTITHIETVGDRSRNEVYRAMAANKSKLKDLMSFIDKVYGR